MARTPDPKLLARVQQLAPGFYTERDSGDWYCVTPHGGRVGEDFENRDDARRFLCWLAGDPLPKGWTIIRANDLFAELDCRREQLATVWVRPAEQLFPGRLSAIVEA